MVDTPLPVPVDPVIYPWVEPIWEKLQGDHTHSTHALMLIGGKGLGKASCALAYTRHLVVGSGDNQARGATLFDAGTHPDVHVLIPEERIVVGGGLIDKYAERYREKHTGKPRKVITIEQVRQLTNAITTFAHIAALKVILILDADLMNRNAANALLKSLEEPSSNTIFLLVSNHPEETPMTIRSRCSMVPFRPPVKEVALRWLAAQPGMEKDNETYLSMAGDSPLLAVQMVRTGYTDLQIRIFKSVAALWNKKVSASEVANTWLGEDTRNVILTLQKLLVDLARFSLSERPANLYYPAQSEWLQRTAKQINLDRVMNTFDAASLNRRLLEGPTDEALLMEDTAVAMARMVA